MQLQGATVITPCDLTHLTSQIMLNGKLVIHPYSFYKNISENEIKYFMHQHGIYVLPTAELIAWLKENIIGTAIEIGAGNGAIARALNIPITDSRMQERADIKLLYSMSGQPVITYPDDVEKLPALPAIIKYKPDTVIGAFITHKYTEQAGDGNMYGVEEELVLSKVKRYINIGNKGTHKNKPVLKSHAHSEHYAEWLITRSVNQVENRIFIF